MLKIKPYDEKLSENVAIEVMKIIKRGIDVKEEIKKLVDRKLVLYKDYEEDVRKAYKKGLGCFQEFKRLIERIKKNRRIVNENDIQKMVKEDGCIEMSYTGELIPVEEVEGILEEFKNHWKVK